MYCKQGHRAEKPKSFLQGLAAGLRISAVTSLVFIVGLEELGVGSGNRELLLSFNVVWALVGFYFLARGFGMRNRGGGVRLFAQHNYGVGTGFLVIVVFIDWAVVKYFLQ